MPVTFKNLGNHGRLGNTIFQAAATIALALRNNDDYIFPNCEIKNYFNIPKNKFTHIKNIKIDHTYEESYFHYSPIPYRKNLNLLGYFQSLKFFDDYQKNIKELFTPKCNTQNLDEDITSIHIRRGDYLQPHLIGCFNILGLDYYYKAMNIIKSNRYMIFSDDIPWCKKIFKGNKFIFSEGNKPIMDLKLMTKCSNHIIANSSFSWWGAWLSNSEGNNIIAPKNWFGPKLIPTHNTKDLIPDGWVII